MTIKKTQGKITSIKKLTPTSKEITFILNEPLNFIAGSFVNIFMNIDGEKIRRAYSISSFETEQNKISLSIRLSPEGKMTPLFWGKDLIGETVELMGPLGLNTANKMNSEHIYLFGFGIGAGVIKSLTEHFKNKPNIKKIIIVTGSRSEEDIVHKEYFDSVSQKDSRIQVSYIISKPVTQTPHKTGYIQNHISEYDFNNSDVYVCGQENACNTLVEQIKKTNPANCSFLIEGFH